MKKFLSVVLAVITCSFMSVNVFADGSPDETDLTGGLSELRWGMTETQVESVLSSIPYDEKSYETRPYENQTLYTYNDITFDEKYNGYLIICVTDKDGLCGVNFHFPTENNALSVYGELCKKAEAEGGIPSPDNMDIIAEYHFPKDNHTVMIFDFGSESQYSYFPLSEDYSADAGIFVEEILL
ncbi:MAG: hypothetical protein IJY83_05335 [Oscillospiraceae bacterium]|nr:hypothetical protein [Oscillospiraceae bacterium]